eukprot:1810-Heterococcus_DN1.PRE.1
MRLPLAPSGCPRAIAPPTLISDSSSSVSSNSNNATRAKSVRVALALTQQLEDAHELLRLS